MSFSLADRIVDHNKTLTQLEQNAFENIYEALEHLSELLLVNTYLTHKNETEKKHWIDTLIHWVLESLRGMLHAKTVEEFNLYQNSFNDAISHIQANDQEVFLSKLIAVCKSNVESIAATRTSYLENISSHARIVKNVGWIALGAALVIVGIVVPPIAPVVISLGAVGLGYGIFDFAKEASEPIARKMSPKLGRREKITPNTKFNHFLMETKTTLVDLTHPAKTRRKKALLVAGLIASGAGLLSGFASLIIVIPALSLLFPPALPFVLAGIGLAAAIGSVAIYGYKLYQERSKLNLAAARKDELCKNAKITLDNPTMPTELDSTALTEKALLGIKPTEHLNQQQQQTLSNSVESSVTEQHNQPDTGVLKSVDHTLADIMYTEKHPQDTYHQAHAKFQTHTTEDGDDDSDGEKDGGAIVQEAIEDSLPKEELKLERII